ncbi:hypothetical protein AK812_SmicGene2580 [Symbiodinium microadriaticum]|uniref:Uncharacterized protein n=1 Tax=Symbiodinium microadriaticum TaxID=2951 RepID=A0A1Q9F1A2_SYMMI|nr:hypothetical protein AK812_SmicGene2580 [Symbiodinium microadriaticum]
MIKSSRYDVDVDVGAAGDGDHRGYVKHTTVMTMKMKTDMISYDSMMSAKMVVSWALIAGIMVIVAIVKKLPYPYRAILDAGVCAGLSWGMGATVFIYAKSVTTGKAPEIDPCLPQEP